MKTGRDVRNSRTKAELKKAEEELRESPSFKRALDTLKQTHAIVKNIAQRETTDNSWIVAPHALSPVISKNPEQHHRASSTEIVISYESSESQLTRMVDGKAYKYELVESAKRKKLFDIMRMSSGFIKRDKLRQLLDCPTNDAVYSMIKTFNQHAQTALRLKKIRIIEGKIGSGYRINPDVKIERV